MGFSVPTITLETAISAIVHDSVVLRPSAIGALTNLTPFGYTDNYECVNEEISDDDYSYVSSDVSSSVSDLYALPNVTFIGTVENLRVIVDAKSHLLNQSTSGIYKIIISDDGGANIYTSSDIELLTSYANYYYVWNVNPRTGVAWTISDINNLQIGVECSSPSVFNDSLDLTLRPNEDGDVKEFSPIYGTDNYKMVDEEIVNYNDWVYKNNTYNTWNTDIYHIQNHLTEDGTINSITVFYYCNTTPSGNGSSRAVVKTGGVVHYGSIVAIDETTKLYSYTWNINPETTVAWTWADVDNLQIGMSLLTLYIPAGNGDLRCQQVYSVINYTPLPNNPEIRTTMEYARVTYIPALKCALPKPITIDVNHEINTNALNFWSGNREVYAISRSSKSMRLSGMMWDGCTDGTSTCEDIINCVRSLGKLKKAITINYLRYTDLNIDYNIISFGWKQVCEKPNRYEWQLDLEFCD